MRSTAKAQHVLSLPALRHFSKSGQLESTIVPDVQTGPYDAALKGVQVVVHAASPVSTYVLPSSLSLSLTCMSTSNTLKTCIGLGSLFTATRRCLGQNINAQQ